MGYHVFERDQVADLALDDVFAFFSDAQNLPRITPSALGFRFDQEPPAELRVGAEMHYRFRIGGLPVRWVARITDWDPPSRFADLQVRGPFAYWLHTHTFRAITPHSTLLRDRVIYRLPLGILGEVARPLLVEPQLRWMFDHREQSLLSATRG